MGFAVCGGLLSPALVGAVVKHFLYCLHTFYVFLHFLRRPHKLRKKLGTPKTLNFGPSKALNFGPSKALRFGPSEAFKFGMSKALQTYFNFLGGGTARHQANFFVIQINRKLKRDQNRKRKRGNLRGGLETPPPRLLHPFRFWFRFRFNWCLI